MFRERVVITENRPVSKSFLVLTFRSGRIAKHARPGHFVQMRVTDDYEPLLPRPMSICRTQGDLVDILYIVAGSGTKLMAELAAGAVLDVWGPLGTTFTPKPEKRLIYVSGGVGVAPMIFLAQEQPVEAFLFGIRTKADILDGELLGVDPSKIRWSSDDGSVGAKGYITELFDRSIKDVNNKDYFIYTCGPHPMMKLIVRKAKERNIPGEVSLEECMACGVGACLGCVVDTKNGRVTACRDGPVLPFEVLPW